MADSMDTSNPIPVKPSEASYRVMRKDREKERQRRFDPLFQGSEEESGKESTEKKDDQKKTKALQDTFEKNGDHESSSKIEKVQSEDEKEESLSDRGHLVDVKA